MLNIIMCIPSKYTIFSVKELSMINSFAHSGVYCDSIQYIHIC